jgi:ankyrin repeat protein
MAIHSGDLELVELIIDKAPNIMAIQDTFGQTALHWAAGKGAADMVARLVHKMHGDNILKQTNDQKYTAFHLAIHSGDEATIGLFLTDEVLKEAPELLSIVR